MSITQNDSEIPVLEAITPEMTLLLGLVLTGLIALICFYLGYRKNTQKSLQSVKVLTQIAVFSALGFVLSFFAIPFILDTHISFHLFPAFTLSMAYGPYVGVIAGFITGSKGLLSGDWTGPVSNAFYCLIIGTLSIYINPEKRARPMYMILVNILIVTWSFGFLHMWWNFAGVVVPFLVILNLLISLVNNILYGIIVEIIITLKQIWEPLTEESVLEWYQDDYSPPTENIASRRTIIEALILNALVYGWFSFIWLTPAFDYSGISLNIYNPLLFVIMLIFAFILLLASLLILQSRNLSLASPLTLLGSILTLPIGILGLYAWVKNMRGGIPAEE